MGFVVDEAFLVAGPDTYRAHLYANLYIDKSQVRVVAPCLHMYTGRSPRDCLVDKGCSLYLVVHRT